MTHRMPPSCSNFAPTQRLECHSTSSHQVVPSVLMLIQSQKSSNAICHSFHYRGMVVKEMEPSRRFHFRSLPLWQCHPFSETFGMMWDDDDPSTFLHGSALPCSHHRGGCWNTPWLAWTALAGHNQWRLHPQRPAHTKHDSVAGGPGGTEAAAAAVAATRAAAAAAATRGALCWW